MTSDTRPPAPAQALPRAAESPMHIGEVATRTDLSLRSLRHWDDVGLVRPSGRTDGGFRLYTQADVDKIMLIRRMKPLGFTLEQMTLAMGDLETLRRPNVADQDKESARRRLADLVTDASDRRAKLERQVAMADEFLAVLAHELR